VGYTSEFAFANAFKREYGMPPGRYRRQGAVSPHPVGFPREHARA
jgi:AraC-like DNA-binding protein